MQLFWWIARAAVVSSILGGVTTRAQQEPNSPATDISSIVTLTDLALPSWGDASVEADITDADYFEFSPQNLEDSQVTVWYSLWTILRQNDTRWDELGEWRLFAHDWHKTKNFECALSMTDCSGDLKLEGLQAIYPGVENRPLVRRIYFASMTYRMFHNYANLILSSFERIKTNLIPMAPELVGSFTHQSDGHTARMCNVIKTIGETSIAISATIATAALMVVLAPVAVAAPIAAAGGAGVTGAGIGTAQIAPMVADAANAGLRTAVLESLKKTSKQAHDVASTIPKHLQSFSQHVQPLKWTAGGHEFSFNWWTQLAMLPPAYQGTVRGLIREARKEYGGLDVEGGYGDGGWGNLCSQFEGDFADRNALNIQKLQTWIPGQFETIRNRIQRLYKDIYEGYVPFPGGPSTMAIMIGTLSWVGDESFRADLRDPQKWQYDLERNFVKGIISKLLSKSYNYITCTHDPKAQELCNAAETDPRKSIDSYDGTASLARSRFCPRPDTDANLICQAEKWYFAVKSQHAREMNGLDQFEGFQYDRFKFRRMELFQESYDNFQRCGNNCTNLNWHRGPFSRDVSFAGTFHLPTCQSDKLHLTDFTKFWGWKAHSGDARSEFSSGEWATWNFPAVCGDHHASETRGFLEAMNAGVQSDVYAHHFHYRATDQLWKDRIPRALDAIRLQPYNHFVAMCGSGVYLPGRLRVGDITNYVRRSPQQGIHFRCKEVIEQTTQMNEYEANKWFCVDSTIGKDIQADSPPRTYVLTDFPRRHLKTYKQRCVNWRKKYRFDSGIAEAEEAEEARIAEVEKAEEAKEAESANSTLSNLGRRKGGASGP